MKVAFYAPMKPPTHASPSGDRRMARLLMRALALAGHEVTLASTFRAWEGRGNRARQTRIARVGERLAARLVRRYRRCGAAAPDVWFTYHLYHKAPDWLGPHVADALDIPYVVAEASHASKQAHGLWADGHRAAAAAIARADAVVSLNRADLAGVEPMLAPHAASLYLAPFLDASLGASPGALSGLLAPAAAREALAGTLGIDRGGPWLLAVAMMRRGAKLASYRLLAAALVRVSTPWTLIVVGDGPARPEVEAAFADFRPGSVAFAGGQSPPALARFHAAADLFVWPAIDEAYGMAILEAQAAGLPVVAGASGGVADIVREGVTGLLARPGDARGFAQAVEALLRAPARRRALAEGARRKVAREHDIDRAAAALGGLLAELGGRACAGGAVKRPSEPAEPPARSPSAHE